MLILGGRFRFGSMHGVFGYFFEGFCGFHFHVMEELRYHFIYNSALGLGIHIYIGLSISITIFGFSY